MGWGTGNIGGGTSLNFDVKSYATEEALLSATPKENTIGIITEHKITGWVFAATEPTEPVEGMVWISTGTSSAIEFNALKKNALQVYPISAKQYVGSAWMSVTAMNYHDAKWYDWVTYYYDNGDECESNGGLWTNSGYSRSGYSLLPPTKEDSYILVKGNGGSTANGFAGKEESVNLTDKDSITAVVVNVAGESGYMLVLSSQKFSSPTNAAAYVQLPGNTEEETIVLDISELSGSYYIAFMTGVSNKNGFKVLEVSA